MNGPMPIMFDMFRAVACNRPKRRSSWGVDTGGSLTDAPAIGQTCAAVRADLNAGVRTVHGGEYGLARDHSGRGAALAR
jgi:hypothetical protein